MGSTRPEFRDWSVFRVGLTGGIASGKSTVASLFGALGVPVIDTDLIAREVVAPGTPGLTAVVGAFGPDVLQADGTLDRRRLRRGAAVGDVGPRAEGKTRDEQRADNHPRA